MNIKEIIDYTRSEVLDDVIEPHNWTDLGLITNFNRAYEELAREAWCIIDSETVSVCRVPLYANQSLHSVSPKVVNVFDGSTLESNGHILFKRTESYLRNLINWKATIGTPVIMIMDSTNRKFSAYPKFDTTGYILGASNISFDAGTKTITAAVSMADFSAGDSFLVSGTTSNNGVFTVDSVGSTTIVVLETLVNETNVSAKLQLERDAALLRVARLPLVPYTEADLDLATPPTPEVDSQWHYGLANGIAKYAFLKPDSETYDPQQSQRNANVFEQFKGDVKLWVLIQMAGNENQCVPDIGTL